MFKILIKIVIIIFIVLAIIFPAIAPAVLMALGSSWPILSAIVTGLATLSPWILGAAAVGIAYALFPDEVESIIEDAGTIVEKVVETGVGVLSTAASGLGSLLGPLALGAGIWFLVTRKKDEEDAQRARDVGTNQKAIPVGGPES